MKRSFNKRSRPGKAKYLKMFSDNLTPEQRKAVKVLQECLPMWQTYLSYDITERDVCFTDYKGFSLQKISYSDLQHGTNWTWNQSNSKKKVLLENDVLAVVQKFNTRKKKKNSPSNGVVFKLWMFTVYKHSESANTFLGVFVWCEKGLAPCVNKNTFTPSLNHCSLLPVVNYQPEGHLNLETSTAEFSQTNIYQNNYQISSAGVCTYSDEEEETVTLADLQFLRPFVDNQTALAFGW